MKIALLVPLNAAIIALFVYVLRRPNRLTYYAQGKVWLTWLSVAVITLMDELTSVFYAPAEAYRFIGASAIVFIAATSLLVRIITTRLVEIAEILEHHGLIGGGVYSFSYLVLGPVVSFVAVGSIMVAYVLTACISAVSAVLNATSFFPMPHAVNMTLALAIIWSIAGLNILGIRENARFTFLIFMFAAVVFLNLIASGIIELDTDSMSRLRQAVDQARGRLETGSWIATYHVLIGSIAGCILAYSGVESVLQTAGLVRSWKDISKAYIFLALTTGIATPALAALALSAPIDVSRHEGDLITHYATLVNGRPFGFLMAALACCALIMAVNTAFVASSELIERVAQRYGFSWMTATNRRQSLYRIHIFNAVFFSALIFLTEGSQMVLAQMYALGLIASFSINIGCLIIYRYFRGTKEIKRYSTNRFLTLLLWIVITSCFLFLAVTRPYGTALWGASTGAVILAGIAVARKRAPEIREIEKTDNEMELILYLAQSTAPDLQLYFLRPREEAWGSVKENEVYITFYSPRQGIPPKLGPNHFRFPLVKMDLYNRIIALLKVVEYEMPERRVTVHIGWPMSSWLDRMSIGVMVFKLMRLPRIFPNFEFVIKYPGRLPQ